MNEQRPSMTSIQTFALPPNLLATYRTLSTIAGHYPLVTHNQGEMSEQIIVYFDTADYHLLRTGYAVRLEQANDQFLLTVENLALGLTGKIDKQISRRAQVAALIASSKIAATLKAWPKALRKAVSPILSGHAKLHPILTVQRKREVRIIVAQSTSGTQPVTPISPLAVLNLDHITVWAPTDGESHFRVPIPESTTTELGQLTAEFATDRAREDEAREDITTEDTTTDQEVITTWLANQPGLQPAVSGYQPWVEQALLAVSRHAPERPGVVGLQPQMLVTTACRLIWQEQLMVMLLKEAGVRYSQDREYVHEMRVAIRRARTVAKLYGHFFARKMLRPYLSILRKTGRLLGDIRNLDVTIAKARRSAKDQQDQRAPKKLLQAWQAQRQVAHEALIKWLDSGEYSDFLSDFHCFCTTPEHPSKRHAAEQNATPMPQQVRHVIPSLIIECYAAVRCYEALFDSAIPVDYTTFHNLRIACKHLRYNLEFTAHLLGPEVKGLIKRLKGLQEVLGDLNDAVVAQKWLDKTAKDGTVSTYQQAQTQRVDELRAQVPAVLSTLVDQDSRQQLGQALAYL